MGEFGASEKDNERERAAYAKHYINEAAREFRNLSRKLALET